jgi:F-type H+-transporting ATPase subunit delta
MDYNRIAVRYAKALLEAANEEQKAENIYNDLQAIAESAEQADFKAMLNNPVYASSVKNKIIERLFADKIEALSLRLLFLLIKKNRENLLSAVIRNYGQLYRKQQNISRVELTTAGENQESFNKEVKEIIEKKFNTSAEITYKHDEALIGGFIIDIENQQLDASIQTKLQKVRKRLTD